MELTYINADGETSYERVVPICFKEHESDWYLLAITENNREVIFPGVYITCVSEPESQMTLLLENFDSERFTQWFFDVEKIMRRRHCD